MNLRKYVLPLLIGVFSIMLSGCTQHDGYIGKWFGSWHLEEIIIDGQEDTSYSDNSRRQVMVSFQGQIFNMAYVEGSEIYGSWSYEGETLTLITQLEEAPSSASFNPYPVVLFFPADVEQVEITVTSLESRTMQWQRIDPNGRLVTYNFKKYP